jgi:hypothetical protein
LRFIWNLEIGIYLEFLIWILEIKNPAASGIFLVLEAGLVRHRRIPISIKTLIIEIGKPERPGGHYPLKTKR